MISRLSNIMRPALLVGRMIFFLSLAACAATPTSAPTHPPATVSPPTPIPTATPVPAPVFKVIAYVTEGVIVETIPFERLTHINYSFLIPNADGSFVQLTNAWKLRKIVDLAHQHNVKVLISVGGWGWDDQFETLAADPVTRSAFVENLNTIVNEYKLDGADIDWEYPDPGDSSRNFLALMTELRTVLTENKLLTAAVVAYGDEYGLGIPASSFALMDFVNVMTYAGSDHGTLTQFESGLRYWEGRGLTPEKTILGLPFYSEPGGKAYRKIVEDNPAAAQLDEIEYAGRIEKYNGIPTIKTKTTIAMQQAGGVMFWTLDHDSLDATSLLLAIDETVHGEAP
jgi:spore germination protein YaaH